MKKLVLLLVVSMVLVTNVYSQLVDVTVDFVSNNTTTGELVFDINATVDNQSETNPIYAFTVNVVMNTALTSAYTSAVSTYRHFTDANGYTESIPAPTGEGQKTLSIGYSDTNAPQLTTIDGTGGATVLIATITINYTPGPGTGTLTAGSTPLQVYDDTFALITGTFAINSLADLPLPVQIANFSANYENNKVDLNWRTESEIETQGFNILRSDAVDGDYKCITSSLLPAKGNATDAAEYSFTDTSIESGKTYWYQVQEVTVKGEASVLASTTVTTKAPATMVLKQNYPNPFNPGTKIQYELAKDSHVTLQVFNILGKKVATLVDANQPAGYYNVDWNGIDQNSNMISSGVYFYQLTANGTNIIKKMTKVE